MKVSSKLNFKQAKHTQKTLCLRRLFSSEVIYYNSNNWLDNLIETYLDLGLALTSNYFIYGIYDIIVFLQY
jgi:hypothetical protein